MNKKKEEDIYVTKSFLPPIEEYQKYLHNIWNSKRLTNQGPLVKDLELKVGEYLGIDKLHFVANGTLALQLSLRALDITEGEVITTPFSYVATTSSILWERCKPVFVDIESRTFCIDADKIEAAITKKTKAIMAVHVFGFPCDIDKIEKIAKKHSLKVIYDGSHAFGVNYKDKSLLNYGDITTCSFHSTKLFHTIEGGCIIARDNNLDGKLELIKRFGHHGDTHYCLGINAKASEFQAAMGLCNLGYISEIIEGRKKVVELYNELLGEGCLKGKLSNGVKHNYAYCPVIFKNEKVALKIIGALNKEKIFPRRYFYPSLNTLPYLEDQQSCPISENISSRILCLPLYVDLDMDIVRNICRIINEIVE